jgi:uncharacterized delta-60 repeat protein
MMRPWLCFVLAACGAVQATPDDFSVALDQTNVFIRRGETKMVTVTVTRTAGASELAVTVDGLPAGVTADPLSIAGTDPGTLALHAADTAAEGDVMLTVHASAGDVSRDAPALRLLVGGASGSLDESFGGNGKFIANVPGMVVVGRALVLSGGGVVVTGSTTQQQVTVKLTSGGTLDASFGGGGLISTGSGAFSEGIAIATTPDDKIVIAGIGNGTADFSDTDFGAFRYSSGGVLDTTFGASGVATFSPGNGVAEAHSVAVASDGSLFISGTLFASPLVSKVVKLTNAGAVDPAFAAPNETNIIVQASVLQPDGKLVVAGSDNTNFWIARYTATGAHDAGFGTGGIVTTSFSPDTAGIFGLVPVAGGKLVAAGVTNGTTPHIVVARYNANGSLDLSFGVGGMIATTIAFSTFSPNAALIDDQNRLVMVGVTSSKPSIARVLPDGTADVAFGTNGIAAVDFGIAGTTVHTGGFGVIVDPDGRILFTGEVGPAAAPPNGEHMIAARLWP